MKKSILSLTVAALMLIILVPAAFATEYVEVIPFKYDLIGAFSTEGLAVVKIETKYGYIDQTGKEVIPLKYEGAVSFREGLAAVCLNNKWGFIDKAGNVVIPLKYDDPLDYEMEYNFSEGLAAVQLNGKWGYIDKSGEMVITPKYDYAESFINGLAAVYLNGKWSFIALSDPALTATPTAAKFCLTAKRLSLPHIQSTATITSNCASWLKPLISMLAMTAQ